MFGRPRKAGKLMRIGRDENRGAKRLFFCWKGG